MDIKNIEIKLTQVSAKGTKGMTVSSVMTKLQDVFDKPYQYHSVSFPKSISVPSLKRAIKRKYKDQIEIRDGCTDGCFGARTGGTSEGLTLWCSPELLPTRCIEPARTSNDDKACEHVNVYQLLIEAGGEIAEDLDGDKFEELCEELGLESKRNNTYYYSGMNAEDPTFMFDADFAAFEGKDCWYLSIKFHCGGDVRGNYTSKIVMKFSDGDAMFSALQPSAELTESEA